MPTGEEPTEVEDVDLSHDGETFLNRVRAIPVRDYIPDLIKDLWELATQKPEHVVSLPGWDDIIRLHADAPLTKEQIHEHNRRRKAGLPTNLTGPELLSYQIRARRAKQISQSPTPEVARDVAVFLTEVDNVQDALVTASVLHRVAVKVAGRAIPGLGIIETGADLLNVIQPLGLISQGVAGRAAKREYTDADKVGTYKRRLRQTERTKEIGFGFGEGLQVAQTTEWVWGVGLRLGPLMGLTTDTLFAIARGAQFRLSLQDVILTPSADPWLLEIGKGTITPQDVREFRQTIRPWTEIRVNFPGVIPILETIHGMPRGTLEGIINQVVQPGAEIVGTATRGLNELLESIPEISGILGTEIYRSLGRIGGLQDDLSFEDHTLLATAARMAEQLLRPFLGVLNVEHFFSSSRESAHSSGIPLEHSLTWIRAGGATPAGRFAGAVTTEAATNLIAGIEGPGATWKNELTDLGRLGWEILEGYRPLTDIK